MEAQHTLTGPRGGGGVGAVGGTGGAGEAGGAGDRYPGGLRAAEGWRPGVGGIVQRPYKKNHGFCVFWDYVTGLPKRNGSKIIGKVLCFLSCASHYMRVSFRQQRLAGSSPWPLPPRAVSCL